jgi:nucleoside-diphosphate-sugar epimerase
MKTALVLGAGGFIGSHMVKRLKSEGYWVRGVDLKYPEFSQTEADEFIIGDLRLRDFVSVVMFAPSQSEVKKGGFDEVYQFACDMGGAGYVFTGEHDADIITSVLINLHVADIGVTFGIGKIFYSSSACMYPQEIQNNVKPNIRIGYSLKESDAYPANPDSEYGWEKLFSERLYLAYARNYGLDVRIARFHNIYGPEGTYKGGKEKAPAAMCRKVIESLRWKQDLTEQISINDIEVWGDGLQTRSFLYINDCIDAVRLLMQSDFKEPINIGSEEMVSINNLAQMAIDLSEKDIKIKNIDGPTGVRGRNSDNTLIRKVLNWEPKFSLKQGIELTYLWIKSQYARNL